MVYVVHSLPTLRGVVLMITRLKSQVDMMVPKRLKDARKNAGLSQEKLVQLADVESVSDKSQVSNYESGRYSPPYEFVVQIARALDYPEAYFYAQDDVFAEMLLQLYRNRANPDFNPYVIEVQELKKKLSEAQKAAAILNDMLKPQKYK